MRFAIGLSLALIQLTSLSATEPPKIAIVPGKAGEPAAIEVSGLPKETLARLEKATLSMQQWRDAFRLVVAGGKAEEVLKRLPVAGAYSLTNGGIRFVPQYPLVPGLEYRALLDPSYDPARSGSGEPLAIALTLPKPPPGPRVSIAGVYPSGNRLPENALRLYLHFSGPVARGDVYRHLKLIRDDGVQVKEPFLELDEELWSVDGTRLTVLFHPGRVKQELVPRLEEGPVLEEGHRYTLTISDDWKDTEGRPLSGSFRKTFTAGPPDAQPIDPATWSIVPPRANSDAPLIIRLPKPLDHALLGRLVWVVDAAGKKVSGTLTVGGGERVLTFAHAGRWTKGEYRLVVDARLEDPCGNRVGEAFEVDAIKPIGPASEAETFERPFTVR